MAPLAHNVLAVARPGLPGRDEPRPGGTTISTHDETLQRLDEVRETLRADGYDLRVDGLAGGRLDLTILALEDACEECLVPKAIMRQVIADSLRDPAIAEINLHYPNEA